MATNFNNTNVKQTVVERFFEGVFSVSEQWAQAFDYPATTLPTSVSRPLPACPRFRSGWAATSRCRSLRR